MPIIQEALLRRPVILNALGVFQGTQTISIEEDAAVAGRFQINGGVDGRGAFYLEDPEANHTAVVLRGAQGNQSEVGRPYMFEAADQGNLGPAGSTPSQINSMHNIDGNFWVLGVNQFNKAAIHWKAPLGTLLSTSGWSDLQSDSPYAAGSAYFMRKASTSGRLYCIVHHTSGSNELMVMRSTSLTSPVFSDISTVPRTSATGPTAYEVRDDGLTQIIAYGASSEGRSTDGGVTWGSLSIGINGITDIVYSRAFTRWVACAPTSATDPGVRFSNDDGVTWSDARLRGSSAGGGTLTRFSHIEKIDAEGRYLVGIRGFAPIRVFISEDGGANWLFSQALSGLNYGASPANPQVILINTGSRILLYQGATVGGVPQWNFDNMYFESGLYGWEVFPLL